LTGERGSAARLLAPEHACFRGWFYRSNPRWLDADTDQRGQQIWEKRATGSGSDCRADCRKEVNLEVRSAVQRVGRKVLP